MLIQCIILVVKFKQKMSEQLQTPQHQIDKVSEQSHQLYMEHAIAAGAVALNENLLAAGDRQRAETQRSIDALQAGRDQRERNRVFDVDTQTLETSGTTMVDRLSAEIARQTSQEMQAGRETDQKRVDKSTASYDKQLRKASRFARRNHGKLYDAAIQDAEKHGVELNLGN